MLLQLCKDLSWCHGGPRSELLSVGFVSIVFNYVGKGAHECRRLQRPEVLDSDGAGAIDSSKLTDVGAGG